MTNKDEALKKKADRYADYWANHYDKKSKADMSFLRKHVFEAFLEVIKESKKQSPEEVSEGYANEPDGCPKELVVLQRFWRKHQQPAQEPVAWMNDDGLIGLYKHSDSAIPLYTHPHQWVGLTDDEYKQIVEVGFKLGYEACKCEQALKEKNYG